MKFNWDGFTENDFADYCARMENGADVDYIGAVRIGDLCFDLVVHDNGHYDNGQHLTYDLYVGGIDSGYGYGKDNYPYDYADGGDFVDTCISMTYDDFKEMCETEFTNYINMKNLNDKANQPLHLW